MDGTIIQQGTITQPATAVRQVIPLRSDVDWVEVTNMTKAAATTQWDGVRYYWQKGMAQGDGIVDYHAAATSAINRTTSATAINGTVFPGILYYDASNQTPGAPIAVTGISNVVRPIVSTGTTTNLYAGSIVRMIVTGVGAAGSRNVSGCDFTIDTITAATSFRIATPLSQAPGGAATTGFYRFIANDTLFYPRRRVPCSITSAAQAVVAMTVTHDFTVGQVVRFKVPAAFGMVELDGLTGTVVAANNAVATNTITVNINTTAMTAFNFPLDAAGYISEWAEVIPVGEDTAAAISAGSDLLGDATTNGGTIYIVLPAGQASPGGAANDVLYWRAGKSFNT